MNPSDFTIAGLYLAYFGRPADPAGLAYWQNIAGKNGLDAVNAEFNRSAEFKAATAGLGAANIVNQFYQTLFGHDADLPGLQYWSGVLAAHPGTAGEVGVAIMNGAMGADRVALDAKVTVSTAFTLMLDTSVELLAYTGDTANAHAKAFLAGVHDVPTMTAALSQLVANGPVTSGPVITDAVEVPVVGIAPHAELPLYF